MALLTLLTLLLVPAAAAAARDSQPLDLAAFEAVADRATPIVGLVLAPVLCFFGLAWYAHVTLALGFLGGGALFALGALLLAESYSTAAAVFMLSAFAGGGALVGWVLWLRPATCTFLAGGTLGVALAVGACYGVGGVPLESPLVALMSAAMMVLVGALFVRFERPAVMAWTSVVGAYWWIYGVGYFAGAFPTWRKIAAACAKHGAGERPVAAAAWGVYLAAFVALAAWSLREQWRREQQHELGGMDGDGDGDGEDGDGRGGDRKREWRNRVASPSAEDVQSAPFRRV